MTIALWIVSAVLATAFLFAGASKLAKPKEALAQQGMAYVEDFSAGTIKLIGASEVLGALGLILPWATGVATVLTPLAATGLVIIMVGAVITHLRRNEPKVIGANIVLLVLAAFVAIGRFAGL